MTHLTTPELIRALGGADAICRAGCSCRGEWQGPERRSVARHAIESDGATRSRTAVHGPIRSPISGAGALGWPVKGKAVDELREWPAGVPKSPEDAGAPSEPPCRYCGGTGTLVYQDEAQPCYCQQPDADVRA